MKQLFLYDFDGTITNKDTLFDFLKFSTANSNYYGGLLLFLPLFVLARGGIIGKDNVKQRFISFFLKGKTRVELSTLSTAYLQRVLGKGILRRSALSSISENKKQGAIYIVSASLDIWLKAISEHLEVGLICTKANYKNDVFDGKFSTPNCNRDEKPKRVARELLLDTYGQISYFGDSKGDFAMKAIVTNFQYRIFDE
ncbi:MAG: HAD family hydrolase [Bacteroidetes bacterium]|nr:HAD family hydrolase [Bacteroidota bacterium]